MSCKAPIPFQNWFELCDAICDDFCAERYWYFLFNQNLSFGWCLKKFVLSEVWITPRLLRLLNAFSLIFHWLAFCSFSPFSFFEKKYFWVCIFVVYINMALLYPETEPSHFVFVNSFTMMESLIRKYFKNMSLCYILQSNPSSAHFLTNYLTRNKVFCFILISFWDVDFQEWLQDNFSEIL